MRILFVLTFAILSTQAFAADELLLKCHAKNSKSSDMEFEVWKHDKNVQYPPLNDYYVSIKNDPDRFSGMEIWKENGQKFKNTAKKFFMKAREGSRYSPHRFFTETLQKIEVDKKTLTGVFNFYRRFIPSEQPFHYETDRYDLDLYNCEISD